MIRLSIPLIVLLAGCHHTHHHRQRPFVEETILADAEGPLAPGERFSARSPSGSIRLIMSPDAIHFRLYSEASRKSTPLPDLAQFPNYWISDPSDANFLIIGTDTDHKKTDIYFFDGETANFQKLTSFPVSRGLSYSLNGIHVAISYLDIKSKRLLVTDYNLQSGEESSILLPAGTVGVTQPESIETTLNDAGEIHIAWQEDEKRQSLTLRKSSQVKKLEIQLATSAN